MSEEALAAISKLASAEADLMESTFVAPVVGNDAVAAFVKGIAYKFSIHTPEKPGWYRFKPRNQKTAKLEGAASLSETESYLARLPKVRIALVQKVNGTYHGIPEKSNSVGLPVGQAVPVQIVDDFADDFDRVICRYDGTNLWYERVDPSNDPSKAAYLRERFKKLTAPKTLKYKGLTFEEKAAYAARYAMDNKVREELKIRSVRGDVEHAGGIFMGLREKSDHYEVAYSVDGQQYTSYVAKDAGHTVISAGICLSGGDRAFDLKSLVTVMREGQREGRIVHGHGDFGHGDHDDDYDPEFDDD